MFSPCVSKTKHFAIHVYINFVCFYLNFFFACFIWINNNNGRFFSLDSYFEIYLKILYFDNKLCTFFSAYYSHINDQISKNILCLWCLDYIWYSVFNIRFTLQAVPFYNILSQCLHLVERFLRLFARFWRLCVDASGIWHVIITVSCRGYVVITRLGTFLDRSGLHRRRRRFFTKKNLK